MRNTQLGIMVFSTDFGLYFSPSLFPPPNDSGLMMYQLAAAAAVYNSVCLLLEYNTYFLFSPIAREYNNHALCLICSTLLLY